jgi:hypothetical protein
VLFGLEMIAKAELIMSSLLVIVALAVSWKCFGNADFGNYSALNWKYLPLLYGSVFSPSAEMSLSRKFVNC